MPLLAILASLFMVFVAVYAHGIRPYQAAAARGELFDNNENRPVCCTYAASFHALCPPIC